MDVELRILKSMMDNAVGELSKLAEKNREIEPKLHLGLTQIGLKLKAPPPGMKSPGKGVTIVRPKTGASGSSSRSGSTLSYSTASSKRSSSRGSNLSRRTTSSKYSVASKTSSMSKSSAASRASHLSVKNIGLPPNI